MTDFDNKEMSALNSLYNAILTLESTEELHKFFTDLCSKNELCSMLHRWQILLLINDGKSYEEIINELAPSDSEITDSSEKSNGRSKTRVSSTTISRVKACYNKPDGGYRTALSRLSENNK